MHGFSAEMSANYDAGISDQGNGQCLRLWLIAFPRLSRRAQEPLNQRTTYLHDVAG